MNLPFEEIARNLNIASSTAHRTYHQFISSNSIDPLPCRKRPEVRVLSDHVKLFVIGLIMDNPCMFISEICKEITIIIGN